ncbi:hypothetical protein LP420_04600 [Massilia sp. B-10]|nr:hypothetical protein LP420_04600 [Massilia sp. B-10]
MAGQRQTGLSHYYEQNDQALQVLTLDRGRYDVVLSDRNIFRYNTLQLKLNRSFQTEERQHPRVRQTQSPRLPARVSRQKSARRFQSRPSPPEGQRALRGDISEVLDRAQKRLMQIFHV